MRVFLRVSVLPDACTLGFIRGMSPVLCGTRPSRETSHVRAAALLLASK
ncbi:MAG TPA: hypothetical protein VK619_19240 [Pyrinomonadaceae bacterium]|nr:hypothetical protein [Pyrinomonadaceae bacterium]